MGKWHQLYPCVYGAILIETLYLDDEILKLRMDLNRSIAKILKGEILRWK